ncbi:MAG TPA: pyridoxamine 5'-phosphate oxidase family protein [Ktedonobacterales bacterium]|nr:pyridoxamine 5'-phosphate oxidase family protein [Ktedonobacterales bacterium]
MSSQSADSAMPHVKKIVHQLFVPFQLPDTATPAGASIAHRLREDLFVWLTTVDEAGVPQPLAVTFLWDEARATFLTYSLPESDRGRLAHIRQNPNVALNFEGSGGDYIIITGEATVSADDPPADQVPDWVTKYQEVYPQLLGITLQQAAKGTIPVRIRPLTLRYVANPRRTTL